MIACVGIGTITGLIFLVVLLFVAGNIFDIIDSAATPLLAILSRATGNNAGAICLLMWGIITHFLLVSVKVDYISFTKIKKVPDYMCAFCSNCHYDHEQSDDLCICQVSLQGVIIPETGANLSV